MSDDIAGELLRLRCCIDVSFIEERASCYDEVTRALAAHWLAPYSRYAEAT